MSEMASLDGETAAAAAAVGAGVEMGAGAERNEKCGEA